MDEAPQQQVVSLAEVKRLLEKEETVRELTYEQKLAYQHAQHFAALAQEKVKPLVKDLLEIDRMTEQNAFKIAEILPRTLDELRSLLAKERFTFETDILEKILSLVEKHAGPA